MSKWEEMVQVEVYIKGKGPVHRVKLPLVGWDKKQIDLEALMSKYRLRAIHAFSLTAGRGVQQFYNPRNGLSLVSYSGKPDSVLRFDGDPKPTVSSLIGRYLVAALLVGLLIVATTTSQAHWVVKIQELTTTLQAHWVVKIQELAGGQVAWLLCFVVMIATQLAWRPFKRRA